MPAQLNVDADELAGGYKYNTDQDPKYAPLIAGSVVALHTKNGTIVSRYKKNLQRLFMQRPIIDYINKCNEWKDEFHLVDWVSHGISLRKNYDMKHFLVKYVHNWLPVGCLVSRYATHYPASCPSCKCEVENRHHMLRCPKRHSSRTKLFTNLKRFMQHYPSNPTLQFVLLRTLKNLFNNSTHNVPTCEAKYATLIQHQSEIGWDQLLLGRFALEWKEFAHRYIKSLPKKQRKKSHSGQSWITQITKIIFNFTYDVWDERNNDRHGRDETEREKILVERAVQQTFALYKIRHKVLPHQ